MIVRARTAALLVCLAFAAACSGTTEQPSATSGSAGPSDGSPGVKASGAPSTGGTLDPGGQSGTNSGSTPGGSGGTVQSYPDDGPVGAMARSYLRGSPANVLRIEIDYVSGREPSTSAIDHLRGVLLSVVDGRKSVIIERGNALPARASWTTAEIDALERSHRQRRSSGNTVTMWIAYLNGSFAEGGGALGVAYKASAAAIFRDRIDDATTAVLLASEIERSVLTHEVGHLLALVNIGYKSAHDHEDAQHPHHSSNQQSVMYWQVEDVSIRSLLSGGPPSDFDADDRADLAMLRSGG